MSGQVQQAPAAIDATISTPDLSDWSASALRRCLAAGEEVRECMRVLGNTGDNVVSEILRDQGAFFEWDHYPRGDVFDPASHAQYYYHAHPESEERGEHGHFHTFLRAKGMPAGVRPARSRHLPPPDKPDEALSHLVAIAMDPFGRPTALFTTNRWVTGETWYADEDVISLLDRFAIDHARPSWPVNRWITGIVGLFRPQIEALIRARDLCLRDWARSCGRRNPFEDRRLEIASEIGISVDGQIDAVTAELARRSEKPQTRRSTGRSSGAATASANRASTRRSRP